nr:hypothetical protein Iba_chr08aCG5810 [Ipomoea batatas]
MSILPFLVKAVDHMGMLWGSTPPNVILYFLGAFLQLVSHKGISFKQQPQNDDTYLMCLGLEDGSYFAVNDYLFRLSDQKIESSPHFHPTGWRRLLFMFLLIAFLPEWCGLPMLCIGAGLERQPVRIGIAKWQKSERGKLNVDSSIGLDSNLMGMGWILHDHHGHLVVANSTVREGAM